mgnify:CR=1 FL=1
MKRYEKNIKIKNFFLGLFSFLVLFSLGTGEVYSKKKKLGVVEEVWGNVFLVEDGKTKQLRAGDYLYDFSEVMTEEGAQVSFSDYYDHQFHLAGSGHIKMMNKIVELVRGYMWVQSYRPTKIPFNIQTANSTIKYYDGEAIISFDGLGGKSQIMVLKGDFKMGNILHKVRHFDMVVADGEFSSIDNEFNGGNPRATTPVGYQSFQKVLSLFTGIKPLDDDNDLYRAVKRMPMKEKKLLKQKRKKAIGRKERDSVLKNYIEGQVPKVAKGNEKIVSKKTKTGNQIIYLRIDKSAKERGKKTFKNYYGVILNKIKKEKKKKKVVRFKPSYSRGTKVPIHIFAPRVVFPLPRVMGQSGAKVKKGGGWKSKKGQYLEKRRKRAIKQKRYKKKSRAQLNKEKSNFEKTLVNEYKKQMRHSEEVNSLIEDLKNYEQNYKKNY